MSGRNRLSVALATYNGEGFLSEQLHSLAAQKRCPDELVVCDDHSSDRTVEILNRFAVSVPFPVRIIQNETRLGPARNFDKVFSLCSGDIIFPCDQDDVWLPDKIEKMENAFTKSPSVGLVISNSALVDADLKSLGRKLYSPAKLSRTIPCPQGVSAIESVRAAGLVAGHTMAFRALPLLLRPWGAMTSLFDVSRGIVAAAISDCVFVHEALTLYRRHAHQQTVCEMKRSRLRFIFSDFDEIINTHTKLARTFASVLELAEALDLSSEILQVLSSQSEMASFLLTLPPSRMSRALPILRKLLDGKYHRFANGYKTAVRDLLIPIPAPREA